VSVSCGEKFLAGKNQENQCNDIEQNKEQVCQTELVEDRWDNVERKHEDRKIENELCSFGQLPGIFSKKRGNVPKVSSKAWLSRSNLRDGVPCPRKIEMIHFQAQKPINTASPNMTTA
jgi:hypothetical protein